MNFIKVLKNISYRNVVYLLLAHILNVYTELSYYLINTTVMKSSRTLYKNVYFEVR